MNQYLLDTDTCIHFLRGKFNIADKIDEVGRENCFVSEITIAELFFGAANSQRPEKHYSDVEAFEHSFAILPIYDVLKAYAEEKMRLRKAGTPIAEFDLLIGITARENELILVSGNHKHLYRIKGLALEDWTKKKDNQFLGLND